MVARKKHADIINKRGLKITGFENKTYRLRAATKINKIERDYYYSADGEPSVSESEVRNVSIDADDGEG